MNLKELKLAIINKDLEKIISLTNSSLEYKDIEEAKELKAYINIAKKMLEEEKSKLLKDMKNLKKLKEYNQNYQNYNSFNLKD